MLKAIMYAGFITILAGCGTGGDERRPDPIPEPEIDCFEYRYELYARLEGCFDGSCPQNYVTELETCMRVLN